MIIASNLLELKDMMKGLMTVGKIKHIIVSILFCFLKFEILGQNPTNIDEYYTLRLHASLEHCHKNIKCIDVCGVDKRHVVSIVTLHKIENTVYANFGTGFLINDNAFGLEPVKQYVLTSGHLLDNPFDPATEMYFVFNFQSSHCEINALPTG